MEGSEKVSSLERMDFLDIAKGIGIILVIIGHTGFCSDGLQKFIYIFHMPLFFMISGILLRYKNGYEEAPASFVKRQVRRLLIPYFAFGVIRIVIQAITYFTQEVYSGVEGVFIARDIIDTLLFCGGSALWFLPALFGGELLLCFAVKKAGRHRFGPLIFTAVISAGCYMAVMLFNFLTGARPITDMVFSDNCYVLAGDNLFVYALLKLLEAVLRIGIVTLIICIGYVMGDSIVGLYEKFKSVGRRLTVALTGTVFLGMAGLLSWLNTLTDLRGMRFGNLLLAFLGAFFGSLGVILISMALRRFRPLSFFGRNSLIIMCTHLDFLILYLAIEWAWLVNEVVTRAKSYIFMINIVAAALLMETVIIFIINRFCPFLTGKGYAKKSERK